MILGNQIRDTIFYLLQFLHLDEWCNILYLSKSHWNSLNVYMKKFISCQLKERLENKITKLGIDKLNFFKLIQQYNGYITGSIHLEILLGKACFKSNDIDIFITANNHAFTNLHRFLYLYSTGTESIVGNKWDPSEKVIEIDGGAGLVNFDHVNAKTRYFSEIIREFTTKYHILNIFTYIISSCKIQIIIIGKTKNNNTNKIWKTCDECDVKEYITTQFDMKMSMSMYNGIEYHLHGILDVYNRRLVFPDYFKQRVKFVSDHEKQRHLKRLEKYKNRTFKMVDVLEYSIYANEIETIVDEGEDLPIADVIERITKRRRMD